MASPDAIPYNRVIERVVPAVAQGVDAVAPLGVAPFDATVTAVTYVPTTTVTGAATDNRTVSLVNKAADASGNTAVATLNFGNGTNATGLRETPIPLSGTAANLSVNKGDVLALSSAHVGAGIADPGGLVKVTLARR